MADIATTEPKVIVAGDTPQWLINLPDYPANDGWELTYVFNNAANRITFAATDSGGKHLAAPTTTAWVAGDYGWHAYVSKAAERYTIRSGLITIKPNYASSDNIDPRSPVKRTLDAINAALESKAAKDRSEYSINGRMLKHYTWDELLKARSSFASLYQQELAAARISIGKKSGNKALVRFTA